MDARAFLARLRADRLHRPSRRGCITGGRLGATSRELRASGVAGEGRRQPRVHLGRPGVWRRQHRASATPSSRVDADVTLLKRPAYALHLVGEGGQSTRGAPRADGGRQHRRDPGRDARSTRTDTFFEVGLAAALRRQRPRRVRDCSWTWARTSTAPPRRASASTTRARWSSYNRIGNDRALRPRRALRPHARPRRSTPSASPNALMATTRATATCCPTARPRPTAAACASAPPMRQRPGLSRPTLDVALLREIRGQGTTELKDFVLVRAGADVARRHRSRACRRPVGLTLGAQFENTSRGGEPIEAGGPDLGPPRSGPHRRGLRPPRRAARAASPHLQRPRLRPADRELQRHPRLPAPPSSPTTGETLARRRPPLPVPRRTSTSPSSTRASSYGRPTRRQRSDYRIGQVFALYSMTF